MSRLLKAALLLTIVWAGVALAARVEAAAVQEEYVPVR
jgi:hypothetical protein